MKCLFAARTYRTFLQNFIFLLFILVEYKFHKIERKKGKKLKRYLAMKCTLYMFLIMKHKGLEIINFDTQHN